MAMSGRFVSDLERTEKLYHSPVWLASFHPLISWGAPFECHERIPYKDRAPRRGQWTVSRQQGDSIGLAWLGLSRDKHALRHVEPLDGATFAVALPVDPDLAIVVYTSLKQTPCTADVSSANRLWQCDLDAVPRERKTPRMPQSQIVTDFPGRVVVIDETRWAAG